MKKLLAVFCIVTASLYGHAGCYEAPGAHAAPHGGLIEHTDNILVELVDSVHPMEIYVLDGDMQPIATSATKVSASVKLPRRSRGSANVELTAKDNYYEARLSTKGRVHRLTLVVQVEQDGITDSVSFEVEPE